MSNTRAMHGKIQIGRNQLGMDEDSYRAMLERVTGKTSRKDCTAAELAKIINELARMGATFSTASKTRPYRVKHTRARSDWQEIDPKDPHAPVKRKICALWRDLGYDMASLDTRVKRQFGVDAFVWLNDPAQLRTLAKDLTTRAKNKAAPGGA